MGADAAKTAAAAKESDEARVAQLAAMREGLGGISDLLDEFKGDDIEMTYDQEMSVRLNPDLSREVVDAFEQARDAHKAMLKQLAASEDCMLKEIDSLSKQLDGAE